MIRVLAFGCLAGLCVTGVAHAASECVRQGRTVCVADGAGVLMQAEGDVRRSRGVGFKAVNVGDDLIAGDRLIVRRGSAVVALSPVCQLPLPDNSLVAFTNAENGFCAHGLFAPDKAPARPPVTPR